MIVSTLGLGEKYQSLLSKKCPGIDVLHIKNFADLHHDQLDRVEGIFTYGYDITNTTVDNMPNLKWVHVGQSGIDGMQTESLLNRHIFVTNSRGINAITISEYVLSMMLNCVRNNYIFYNKQLKQEWDMETHLDELYEKTVGIFGLGKAGKEVAKRCKAFGMKVIGVDLFPCDSPDVDAVYKPDEKDVLFREADYIVINMPLTDQTRNMLNKKAFAMMKPTAIVINAARGGIISEENLIVALREHQIAGAVLDVFFKEPLSKDSPLWRMDNVIITPHIAGDRQKSYMPRMMQIACKNLQEYPDFSKMTNLVNLENGF